MENPLVSIIIPVFNGSNYLRESIESALNQTYRNIEVIVINDGSNDEGLTEKIALSYEDKIRYYSKENGGVSSALNLGINEMCGDWFSWLSHDDLYNETKIERQIYELKKSMNEKAIIITGSKQIDKDGNYIKNNRRFFKKHYSGDEMFKLLFSGKSLNGCALLIPKTALLNSDLFDENFKFIQDWKMWVKLSLKRYDFIYINEYLVDSRIHAEQQTIKIKNVSIIEVNSFINDLIEKLPSEISKDKLLSILKYNKCDKIRYLLYYLKGRVYILLISIYRYLHDKRFRII